MIDLHKLLDLQINVLFATTFLMKTIQGPPVISSCIFQANHYHSKRMGKNYSLLSSVDRYALNSVVCSRALTCLSLCVDKIQSFSA